MKKIFNLIILLLFIVPNIQAETIIRGKITNTEDKVSYQFTEMPVSRAVYGNIELYKDSFELRLDLMSATKIEFYINTFPLEFYVMPDDTLFFSCNADSLYESLIYSCKNMLDQEYTLGLSTIESEKYLGLKPYEVKNFGWKDLPKGLMDTLNQRVSKKKKLFVNAHQNNKAYSKSLKADIVNSSYQNIYGDIYLFQLNKSSNIRLMDTSKVLSKKELTEKLKNITIEVPDLIRNEHYMKFLLYYFYFKYDDWISENNNTKSWQENQIEFVNYLLTNQEVKYALMCYINGGKISGKPELYLSNLKKIKEYFPEGKYNKKMESIALSLRLITAGQPAPEFELKDLNGKEVALSDFNGKIVYIDFWASWCLPCVLENKEVKEIKTMFEDKDIVFLYITKDLNEEAWRDAIVRQNIEGVHLLGGDDSVFDIYQAHGVPKYVLINRDGKIISANAPRPSSKKELIELFNQALSQ